MSPTSLNEASLELQIMSDLTGVPVADIRGAGSGVREFPVPYDAGWIIGSAEDYDRSLGLDVVQLVEFLQKTQPKVVEGLRFDQDGPSRDQFLQRLSNAIMQQGVIKVLRKGVQHQQFHVDLYYPTPTPGNTTAETNFRANRFIVTRQLRYSTEETQRALDLAVFINGLPVFTFELKNTITSQTVSDAMQQYRASRPPSERLFRFGTCIAHFAVDDQAVHFTTKLAGKSTWFLPFNKGDNDGSGNPPNPDGIKTDYLWKQVFTRESLANILESFVQQVEERDEETGKKRKKIVFPRYHQIDVVRRLLADAASRGAGQRYLIQHSAGSGKSNSIAWLAQQLVELQHDQRATFDSVIVVTDRRILDTQINNTIKAMSASTWMIGHADRSGDLRKLITEGKRIIITTVQKFPFIVNDIGDTHRDRTFAVIIDEAHSSQGGRASSQMNAALGAAEIDEHDESTDEDQINALIENRKMLENASYFAFTATPKQRTLELFGEKRPDGQFAPFHTYSMKQAIDEGFILDVLKNYTPISSYYRLVKTIDDDPEFDVRKAGKELRTYVESDPTTIERKAKIIVDHFAGQTGKIDGQARAMVATQSIRRAIDYWQAINRELATRGNPWKTIVAFTGEHDIDGIGAGQTEYTLNGFPSADIPKKMKESPYRMLIVADKFLTGYDEPLLQTMYVDKTLSGVKAVQALSRLNRSHPGKKETFILDFANDPEQIVHSFQPYYKTTMLAAKTDPNKLHDMKARLDDADVYQDRLVVDFVDQYLAEAPRPELDAMLDICVTGYKALDEDEQISFKGTAKAFVRTYNFLSQILPWGNADWERLSIFLTFLTPRLPAPKGDESSISEDILAAIDLDSYRAEQKKTLDLILQDDDAQLENPDPTGIGGKPEPEYDRLSSILQTFNEIFADANFTDHDRVARQMSGPVMDALVSDVQLRQIAGTTDEQNQRIAFADALDRMVNANWQDNYEVLLRLGDDPNFRDAFGTWMFRIWQNRIATSR
ncbi:MAG TPA: type I restriction endonuclease [Thermomicrobiales bacterium]|nr:type I restriction endonuclease [Thermomicrobiales bacterium]